MESQNIKITKRPRNSIKNKIVGTLMATYIGAVAVSMGLQSYLENNFDYIQERPNGQVVSLENRLEKDSRGKPIFLPIQVTLSYGDSFVSGKDTDYNGSLDKITLDLRSEDAQKYLLPLATQKNLEKTQREITQDKEYQDTILKRQRLGGKLWFWTMASLMLALPLSNIYKFKNATPEQLKHPFFHCK